MNFPQLTQVQKAVPRRPGRRHRQAGELSMIEAGAVLAAAALLALAIYEGAPFVRNLVQAYHFKTEAGMFHTGVQNATQNDADFSSETLTSLAQNRAFDSAGSRVSSDFSTVQGLFGGEVTATPASVTTSNDAVVVDYPVPTAVCSLSVAALAETYTQITVNGTTVFSPTLQFSSTTAGAACRSSGETATIGMYTTRS
jgi:hypothetical protein